MISASRRHRMRAVDKRRLANIGLGLLAVLTVVMVVLAFSKQAGPPAGTTAVPQPAASTPAASGPSAGAPRAVFLGDSSTVGTGGDGTTWTSIVAERKGWTEVNLGRGGTGYVTSRSGEAAQRACGLATCPSYQQMVNDVVAAKPDVIVVSGGREDGASSVSTAAGTLFRDLRSKAPNARIVVVSPLWDESPVPADLAGTTTAVQTAARQAGLEYLDIGQPLSGRADLVSADGVNPNAAGYRAVADAVTAKLK